MAFEYKRYTDGEQSFRTPEWRKQIEKIRAQNGNLSFYDKAKEQSLISENETVLKHPENGSYLRMADNGSIELFSGFGTGIRISPDENIQFFSDHLQFIGKEIQVVSHPNASNINGSPLDGQYPSVYKKGLSSSFLNLTKAGEADD